MRLANSKFDSVLKNRDLIIASLFNVLIAPVFAFLMVLLLMLIGPHAGLTADEISVTGMYILSAIGFALLWKLIHPLNKYRIAVFAISILGMIFMVSVFWSMFMNSTIRFGAGLAAIGLAIACVFVSFFLITAVERLAAKKEVNEKNEKKDPV